MLIQLLSARQVIQRDPLQKTERSTLILSARLLLTGEVKHYELEVGGITQRLPDSGPCSWLAHFKARELPSDSPLLPRISQDNQSTKE